LGDGTDGALSRCFFIKQGGKWYNLTLRKSQTPKKEYEKSIKWTQRNENPYKADIRGCCLVFKGE